MSVYGKDWSKKQIKDFNKLKDWQIPIPLATACKVHLDGAKWEDETKEFCDRKVAELLKAGAASLTKTTSPRKSPRRSSASKIASRTSRTTSSASSKSSRMGSSPRASYPT